MNSTWSTAVLVSLVVLTALLSVAVTPAAAASPPPDECANAANADRGPGAGGLPGFVAGIVPDFLGDVFAGLPVPNFVKAFVGAPTC